MAAPQGRTSAGLTAKSSLGRLFSPLASRPSASGNNYNPNVTGGRRLGSAPQPKEQNTDAATLSVAESLSHDSALSRFFFSDEAVGSTDLVNAVIGKCQKQATAAESYYSHTEWFPATVISHQQGQALRNQRPVDDASWQAVGGDVNTTGNSKCTVVCESNLPLGGASELRLFYQPPHHLTPLEGRPPPPFLPAETLTRTHLFEGMTRICVPFGPVQQPSSPLLAQTWIYRGERLPSRSAAQMVPSYLDMRIIGNGKLPRGSVARTSSRWCAYELERSTGLQQLAARSRSPPRLGKISSNKIEPRSSALSSIGSLIASPVGLGANSSHAVVQLHGQLMQNSKGCRGSTVEFPPTMIEGITLLNFGATLRPFVHFPFARSRFVLRQPGPHGIHTGGQRGSCVFPSPRCIRAALGPDPTESPKPLDAAYTISVLEPFDNCSHRAAVETDNDVSIVAAIGGAARVSAPDPVSAFGQQALVPVPSDITLSNLANPTRKVTFDPQVFHQSEKSGGDQFNQLARENSVATVSAWIKARNDKSSYSSKEINSHLDERPGDVELGTGKGAANNLGTAPAGLSEGLWENGTFFLSNFFSASSRAVAITSTCKTIMPNVEDLSHVPSLLWDDILLAGEESAVRRYIYEGKVVQRNEAHIEHEGLQRGASSGNGCGVSPVVALIIRADKCSSDNPLNSWGAAARIGRSKDHCGTESRRTEFLAKVPLDSTPSMDGDTHAEDPRGSVLLPVAPYRSNDPRNTSRGVGAASCTSTSTGFINDLWKQPRRGSRNWRVSGITEIPPPGLRGTIFLNATRCLVSCEQQSLSRRCGGGWKSRLRGATALLTDNPRRDRLKISIPGCRGREVSILQARKDSQLQRTATTSRTVASVLRWRYRPRRTVSLDVIGSNRTRSHKTSARADPTTSGVRSPEAIPNRNQPEAVAKLAPTRRGSGALYAALRVRPGLCGPLPIEWQPPVRYGRRTSRSPSSLRLDGETPCPANFMCVEKTCCCHGSCRSWNEDGRELDPPGPRDCGVSRIVAPQRGAPFRLLRSNNRKGAQRTNRVEDDSSSIIRAATAPASQLRQLLLHRCKSARGSLELDQLLACFASRRRLRLMCLSDLQEFQVLLDIPTSLFLAIISSQAAPPESIAHNRVLEQLLAFINANHPNLPRQRRC